MRFLAAAILLLFANAAAHATAQATLTWQPVTQYSDGTAIPASVSVTYNVYQSTSATGTFSKVQGPLSATTAVIAGLADGSTTYWYVTTTAAGSPEGAPSNIVNKTAPKPTPPAAAPAGLSVTIQTTAYYIIQQPNKFVAVPVGTVPAGTPCDASQAVNGLNVVDRSKVAWYGSVKPLVVVTPCT